MTAAWVRCVCEHTFDEHSHYNHMSYCGRCECREFKRPTRWQRFLARVSS